MKKILVLALLPILVLLCNPIFSQDKKETIENLFRDHNELYFETYVTDKSEIAVLTKIVSIDNVKGNIVTAFATKKQFARFLELGYPYTILAHPQPFQKKELNVQGNQLKSPLTTWNFYPTYDEYINLMNGFVTSYPALCRLVNIGTTNEGRQIIAVELSDSLDSVEGEPEVLFSSSIHGDETTGYVLMLHLIDSLLTGYGQNPRITEMVNNTRIFINPLTNPDGTYHEGNQTICNYWRGNSNGIDLNRNFPDPKGGQHPDGEEWQTETLAFMRFDSTHHVVMSMMFHGGEEVFNYPWDTWVKLHADDEWLNFVGREYADTVHQYSPSGYFTGPNHMGNGVTNGNAWYEIEGGRQDYMTYFHNGRDITLEISITKTLPESQLLKFWNYNCRSFLNYISQAQYGINGKVTDSVTNLPLKAKVLALGHDLDNSYVYSGLPSGWYFRPIYEGTYALNFSAPGYFSKTITGVNVTNRNTTRLNVKLVPLSIGFVVDKENYGPLVFPNPSDGRLTLVLPDENIKDFTGEIFNTFGQKVYSFNGKMEARQHSSLQNLSFLNEGLYLLKIKSGNACYEDKIIIRK